MDNIIIIAIGLFILFDILLVTYIFYKRKKKGLSKSEKEKLVTQWRKIKADSDMRHAVMDADKLLDLILARKGYTGPLGEKLKRSRALFSDLNGVWSAHKLRNRLAHELDMNLSSSQAQTALRQFEKAFRDLGVL